MIKQVLVVTMRKMSTNSVDIIVKQKNRERLKLVTRLLKGSNDISLFAIGFINDCVNLIYVFGLQGKFFGNLNVKTLGCCIILFLL